MPCTKHANINGGTTLLRKVFMHSIEGVNVKFVAVECDCTSRIDEPLLSAAALQVYVVLLAIAGSLLALSIGAA